MTEKFRLPATPAEADKLADELGVLARATKTEPATASAAEWKRAALVYAQVLLPEEHDKEVVHTLFGKYALRGIRGLQSQTAVRKYWRAWDYAIFDGMAQPVKLGDEGESYPMQNGPTTPVGAAVCITVYGADAPESITRNVSN